MQFSISFWTNLVDQVRLQVSELQEFFLRLGWKIQRRHLYTVTENGVRLRIILGDRAIRIESQPKIFSKRTWFRIGGDFYSRVIFLPDGRLRVGTMFFGEENVTGLGSTRRSEVPR